MVFLYRLAGEAIQQHMRHMEKETMNKDTYNYIDLIKQTMVERSLSQQALANILGVNQTTVSQWLLGRKKPTYDNIYTFCKKFDVTPNEFFGFEC